MLFELEIVDNGSHMVGSCDRVDPRCGVPVCAVCGHRTDPVFTAPGFRLRGRRFDISCCPDGAVIVSETFRVLCERMRCTRMECIALPGASGHHHLRCVRPLALDLAAMGTRRLRYCDGCARHLDVVGCEPVVLRAGETLDSHELAFSDTCFGSNNEAIPLLICGSAFADALRATAMSGVDALVPIAR